MWCVVRFQTHTHTHISFQVECIALCISYNIIFLSGKWIINRRFDSDGCTMAFEMKFIDIKPSIYGGCESCFMEKLCICWLVQCGAEAPFARGA